MSANVTACHTWESMWNKYELRSELTQELCKSKKLMKYTYKDSRSWYQLNNISKNLVILFSITKHIFQKGLLIYFNIPTSIKYNKIIRVWLYYHGNHGRRKKLFTQAIFEPIASKGNLPQKKRKMYFTISMSKIRLPHI